MKRNRKVKKHAIFKSGFVGVIVLIVTGFIMLMAYWSLDSRCASIAREIGTAEKRFSALEAECVQAMASWDGQKTPEKLSEKLVRFGLEMRYARQDQIVRMGAGGSVVSSNQISVVRARQRARTPTVAMQDRALVKEPRIRTSLVAVPSRGRTTARH